MFLVIGVWYVAMEQQNDSQSQGLKPKSGHEPVHIRRDVGDSAFASGLPGFRILSDIPLLCSTIEPPLTGYRGESPFASGLPGIFGAGVPDVFSAERPSSRHVQVRLADAGIAGNRIHSTEDLVDLEHLSPDLLLEHRDSSAPDLYRGSPFLQLASLPSRFEEQQKHGAHPHY